MPLGTENLSGNLNDTGNLGGTEGVTAQLTGSLVSASTLRGTLANASALRGVVATPGQPPTSGAGDFLALSDTPDSYSGYAGYVPAVNEAENALEFISVSGLQGPKGDKGDTGAIGPAGPTGADGADGESAYQIALDNGFVGTEAEWLASLVGPPGSGSGGSVTSVNTQTGDVVLDADDIDDTATTHKFATAAQLADIASAVQPGDLATVATSGAYSDLTGMPSIPTAFTDLTDVPHDYTNNANKVVVVNPAEDALEFQEITFPPSPVTSVNEKTGDVVLDPDDLDDLATTHKFVSAAEKGTISTAVQPGDLASVAFSGNYGELFGLPTLDDIADGVTNKAYTATEKTKLAGIAAGAEVNVNADWDAVSGDAQILNKPTLATVATTGSHTDLSNIGTNTHAQIDTHIASTSNPHSVTKSQVGLGNVDNTSDVTKNSAVAALTNKDLTSGTNTFPTFNQSTTGNAATATKLTTARNIDGQAFDGTANITVVAPAIHAATSQTPVDADEFGFWDSVGNILKKASLASLKSTFKTYFDTLYNLYVHPNHTGDVTSVGDGATTIAANAVTNAKAAQMATATIKGRTTTGTGNPEDLTASQAAAIIQGSITSLTAPALTGVTTIAGVGSVQALDPGSITTSQTWTVTITMSTANRKYCVFDIFLAAGSGTAFEYALYRANVGMLKNPVGSVVGAFIHEQVNAANNATITALATTTSGVVMSVSGLSSTFNSNSLMVIGIINAASITVSSVVA